VSLSKQLAASAASAIAIAIRSPDIIRSALPR
jgi:hypothetical protein